MIKITKGQKVGLLISVLLLLAMYLFTEYKKKEVENSSSYSVAMIYRYFRGTSTGPMFEYKYYVKDQLYQGGIGVDNEDFSKYKNRFFKVKYSKENPSWSQILLNERIYDTIAIKAAGFSIPTKKRNQFQEY